MEFLSERVCLRDVCSCRGNSHERAGEYFVNAVNRRLAVRFVAKRDSRDSSNNSISLAPDRRH